MKLSSTPPWNSAKVKDKGEGGREGEKEERRSVGAATPT